MNVQLAGLERLLAAGIGKQAFGQFRTLPVGDHPADYMKAEDIQDHIQIEVGPLSRPEQLRNVPTPELVRAGGQKLGLLIPANSNGVSVRSQRPSTENASKTLPGAVPPKS